MKMGEARKEKRKKLPPPVVEEKRNPDSQACADDGHPQTSFGVRTVNGQRQRRPECRCGEEGGGWK